SQTVTTALATDGYGTMTVSPTGVTFGQSGLTQTFTFAVPAGNYDFANGSAVVIAVPSTWTAPQKGNPGGAGYVQVSSATCSSVSTGTGNVAISGYTITIAHSCDNGQQFVLTYGNVAAPTAEGSYTFTTSTDDNGVA